MTLKGWMCGNGKGAVSVSDDPEWEETIRDSLKRRFDTQYCETDLHQCPNPQHKSGWHGMPKEGCPGSHLMEWPDMEPDDQDHPAHRYVTPPDYGFGLGPLNIPMPRG
jgi:hypothetical protein